MFDILYYEDFEKSIIEIENPTIQKIIDSKYFTTRWACLSDAFKILVKYKSVNVTNFDELNNFLINLFGEDNIKFEIKDGIEVSSGYDFSEFITFYVACKFPDCQQCYINIDSKGRIYFDIYRGFDINKLFSNNKVAYYNEQIVKIIKINKEQSLNSIFKDWNYIIEKRENLDSGAIYVEYLDQNKKKKYALGYYENTYPHPNLVTEDKDEKREPEYMIILIGDSINKEDDFYVYDFLTRGLKYNVSACYDTHYFFD